jgi:hypothetical protein
MKNNNVTEVVESYHLKLASKPVIGGVVVGALLILSSLVVALVFSDQIQINAIAFICVEAFICGLFIVMIFWSNVQITFEKTNVEELELGKNVVESNSEQIDTLIPKQCQLEV